MVDHYYSEKPTAKSSIKTIHAILRNIDFDFTTDTSIFSKTKVDNGTAILIEEAQIEPGSKILDLGCGYGVLGIALKKACPQCEVTLTDVNQRATGLAKKNARLNGVVVETFTGDRYIALKDRTFDAIYVNPPQRAGRELCNSMIEQAPEHLVTGGSLWLVARHNFGGAQFEKKMEEVFGNVETIARQSGFRVYRSKKNN